MERKKIAYILTPIEFGGAERVNLTFLKTVDRGVFDIYPILLIRPWERENFFLRQLDESKYPISKIPVGLRPPGQGRDYFRIVRSIRILHGILSKDSFHLVHTHGYFADIIAGPVCWLLKIPRISTCHGFISNDWHLKIYNALDRFSLRFCDRIIAVSEGVKDDLIRSGIKESKIIVIQNAIQNSYSLDNFIKSRLNKRGELGLEENDHVAGYVGRLSEEKGLRYLIEASSILKGQGQAFKILIIGDGPKRKELENFALEKGLEKEIIFTGFQSDVDKWFPALDVFVLPSLTEGTPMALLEAMAIGMPVIATGVGGVPKIIEDGVNGLLMGPADSQALAQKVKALFQDTALCRQLSNEARNTIKKRYNVHEWCKQIESQYDRLLKGRD